MLPATIAYAARPLPSICKGAPRAFASHSHGYKTSRGVMGVASSAQKPKVTMAVAKQVLVPISDGIEEMEAVTIIDVLRRAGAEVTVASVEDRLQITASRKVKLVADKLIADCHGPFDVIALPGGMPGAERLRDSQHLSSLLKDQKESGRFYAAICASPAIVLEAQGLLARPATSHPAFSDKLKDQSCVERRVVVDGTCTTSRGPGTAIEFALALTKQLYGEDKAKEVAGPMVVHENVHMSI